MKNIKEIQNRGDTKHKPEYFLNYKKEQELWGEKWL